MNASKTEEAEVGVKFWKQLWHCHPTLNSSAFKRYMSPLFLPLTLTLPCLTLPAKMVCASSLGWAWQPITFLWTVQLMEEEAVWPHKPHTSYCSTTRWENMSLHSRKLYWELHLFHVLRWTNKGITGNLQLLFHHLLGVCFHTFLFGSGIWLWYIYAYREHPFPLCKILYVAIPG